MFNNGYVGVLGQCGDKKINEAGKLILEILQGYVVTYPTCIHGNGTIKQRKGKVRLIYSSAYLKPSYRDTSVYEICARNRQLDSGLFLE